MFTIYLLFTLKGFSDIIRHLAETKHRPENTIPAVHA